LRLIAKLQNEVCKTRGIKTGLHNLPYYISLFLSVQ